MKLKNLNGAIRKVEGAVRVKMATPAGPIALLVQKTPLIESLREIYGEPTAETHMFISDDGYLSMTDEGATLSDDVKQHYRYEGSVEPEVSTDDDDDLLLDAEEARDADFEAIMDGLKDAVADDDDLGDLLG